MKAYRGRRDWRRCDLSQPYDRRARSDWRQGLLYTLGIAGLVVLVLTGLVW